MNQGALQAFSCSMSGAFLFYLQKVPNGLHSLNFQPIKRVVHSTTDQQVQDMASARRSTFLNPFPHICATYPFHHIGVRNHSHYLHHSNCRHPSHHMSMWNRSHRIGVRNRSYDMNRSHRIGGRNRSHHIRSQDRSHNVMRSCRENHICVFFSKNLKGREKKNEWERQRLEAYLPEFCIILSKTLLCNCFAKNARH